MRPPPTHIFLQTNQRCNLRCTHCNYWQHSDADRANYLSLERRRGLVKEFAELGGKYVVTCGGEPTLDLEDLFDLTAAARSSGLGCLTVTNGTRINSAERAERMLAEGPSEITLSLDHWQVQANDRLRGRPGAHNAVCTALDYLLTAREKMGARTPIYVMTILSEDTWPTLDCFFQFVLVELGADKLKLNVLQPTFGQNGPDEYFQGSRVSDVAACIEMIRFCDEHFGLMRNPKWLADVEMYLRSVEAHASDLLRGWATPDGTHGEICNSRDRNIMVDLYGKARLCFSHHFPASSLRGGDLADFWHSQSLFARDQMEGCKRWCGISHSVRASSSLRKTPS